jgi:VWFA-related protein
MMNRILLAVFALLLSSGTTFAQVDERIMYVSVVDKKGDSVPGLTERDFIVREDGQAREILRVVKDNDPLQIALLIDNSAEMREQLSDLRRAIGAFVTSLRPGVQMALITTGERPTIVVPYTAEKAALQKGIERINTLNDSANYVLDGIAEVSQGLAKRPGTRSVIATVTARGPEFSYRDYTTVLRIVRDSGTPSLHAIMVGGNNVNRAMAQAKANDHNERGTDRDIVLAQMTKETGGRYEEVLAMSALTMKLEQLSGELSNQYRVTFARPQRLVEPKTTEVSARDPELNARGMLAGKN